MSQSQIREAQSEAPTPQAAPVAEAQLADPLQQPAMQLDARPATGSALRRAFKSARRAIQRHPFAPVKAISSRRFERMIQQPVEPTEGAWPLRMNDPNIFAMTYRNMPDSSGRFNDVALGTDAFFHQRTVDGTPIHVGSSRRDAPEGAAVVDGVVYNGQLDRDFPRGHLAYESKADGTNEAIEQRDDAFHRQLTNRFADSARAEFDAGRGTWDGEAGFNEAAVRQRIARALHSRTQTFDADALNVIVNRTLRDHGKNANTTNSHTAHTYEVSGNTLVMRTYQVLSTHRRDAGALDTSHFVQMMRREGAMNLHTGEMSAERVYLSKKKAIASSMTKDHAPVGHFVASFGDAGSVAFEASADRVKGSLKKSLRVRDLAR